jgi:hypothetical protein
MADYSFGGTDEDNAELKKLNQDVVRLVLHDPEEKMLNSDSLMILIASRTGKSL